ncbi:Holliday junction branch migration protein RuvA [Jiangella alba]|uniref:Holliday junction branch migration complex subunit RuvA n=1 Tax=Jiangella alba TaxID=561176 RepID=A0A1H5MB81_9ACTN|nr:Holliday junction branch migration protein RuvA [Jiangella alba]SEE85941.1 Holliday junction DNA helicase subunit RuvA [Jiangella alba]
MIAYVRGQVTVVRPTEAVVDVGGIGLALHCTPATTSALRLGEVAQLAASLVVREESLTLYGFADEDEKTVFELLQTASGVGPRLAQAMLSVHSPDDLRRAVATEDLVALTKVPGIGKKGAQRIVIELKDKLGMPGSGPSLAAVPSAPAPGAGGWQVQVHEALLGLGWSAREADRAVDTVATDLNGDAGDLDVSALLRKALRSLART